MKNKKEICDDLMKDIEGPVHLDDERIDELSLSLRLLPDGYDSY